MRRRVLLEIDLDPVGDGKSMSNQELDYIVKEHVETLILNDILAPIRESYGFTNDKKEVVVNVRVHRTSHSDH